MLRLEVLDPTSLYFDNLDAILEIDHLEDLVHLLADVCAANRALVVVHFQEL